MRLYLSSFRLGLYPAELVRLAGGRGAKTAVVLNATDFLGADRKRANDREFVDLRGIGLVPEELDLRDYFGNPDALAARVADVKLIWVRGGNVFVLRRAMHACGFDAVVKPLIESGKVAYGGYSAGACVAAPSLEGLELVDNAAIDPPRDGMGLVDFCIVPHYRSDHPESAHIERVAEYMDANNVAHRKLHDGEVIVVENGVMRELSFP